MKRLIQPFFLIAIIAMLSLILPPSAGAFDYNLDQLQKALGIRVQGETADYDLSTLKEGDAIPAVVTNAEKIGGSFPGDRLSLIYSGGDSWKMINVETRYAVNVVVKMRDGEPVVQRTDSYKAEEASFKQAVPGGESAPAKWNKRFALLFKAGGYTPTDDLHDFNGNFAGEIALDYYLSRNVAIEAGVGYFKTDDDDQGAGSGYEYDGDADVYAIPMMVSLKGFYPMKYASLYCGGGLGVVYVDGKLDVDVYKPGDYKKYSDSDTDFVFGGQFFGGVNFDLSERAYFGIEGKYVLTSRANLRSSFYEADINLTGAMVTGVLGFRF